MNIIYDLQGFLPSLNSGGPPRIPAMIFEEKYKENDKLFNEYVIASGGVYNWLEIKNNFHDKHYYKNSKSKIFIDKLLRYISYKFPFISNTKKLELMTYFYEKNLPHLYMSLISKLDNHIIHSHNNHSLTNFSHGITPSKRKIILTFHSKGSIVSDYQGSTGLNPQCKFAKNLRLREIKSMELADIITFPSRGAKSLMESEFNYVNFLREKDIRIIYNGIEIDKINKFCENNSNDWGTSKFRIINIAEHVTQKRIDLILDALAILKNEFDFEFINIGSGILTEELLNKTKKLGLKERVNFIGKLKNQEVIELLKSSNVFVLPSENVVFDLVTLEAMAVGLPVIVSADGGNLETIKDGFNGLSMQKGNLGNLINHIRYIYQNKEKAKQMGLEAKKLVYNKYSSKQMFNEYMKLYEELNNKIN
jgi:glycosyltransferase involved in cell wall biosynthesis